MLMSLENARTVGGAHYQKFNLSRATNDNELTMFEAIAENDHAGVDKAIPDLYEIACSILNHYEL